MLHLAQVIKDTTSSRLKLHLLAVEESKLQWTLCLEKYIPLEADDDLPVGVFLLVEIDEENKLMHSQSAKSWILSLVQEYLVEGNANTNINIPEEEIRLEQWRQELTSQSQDLARIRLEVETRREELQQLEQNLSLEREQLKSDQGQ